MAESDRAGTHPDLTFLPIELAQQVRAMWPWTIALAQLSRLIFWSMSTLPLSEVKARLSEIADEVDRTHDRVHVTRNGREYVVLLSAEDLESLEATIELLRDDAGMERIRAADAAAATGDVTTGADMAALMDERRQREHRDG